MVTKYRNLVSSGAIARCSMKFLLVLCCSIFLGSVAWADVCFLPSMDCADANAGNGGGGGNDTPSCYGYDSTYKSRSSGWECEGPCNGKYRCSCSVSGFELRNGQCVKIEDPCADYTYSSNKGGLWSCEKCTDGSSGNRGKWKCECSGKLYNGDCIEDPCGSSYSFSSSQASSMKDKGYTCSRCTASVSDYSDKYNCTCPESKVVDDSGACVEAKNCTKSGKYDSKEACEKAIKNTTDDYACEPTDGGKCYMAVSTCKFTDTEGDSSCASCKRGGKTYYYCTCLAEDDPNNPCYGKYHCQGGREPEGEPVTCSCGDVSYYDRCWVYVNSEAECAVKIEKKSVYYNDDSEHNAQNKLDYYSCSGGYYKTQDICTYKGRNYMYCTACDGQGLDINGQPTPGAQGWKYCSATEKGVGESYTCGSTKMYKECVSDAEAIECAAKIEKKSVYYNDDSEHNAQNKLDYYSCSGGYYKTQDICTYNGKNYMYCTACDGQGLDINGQPTPGAQGWKYCSATEEGVGESYTCGSTKMYKECKEKRERIECNGNFTEDSRYADKHCPTGTTFVHECYDNSNPPVSWGHCN